MEVSKYLLSFACLSVLLSGCGNDRCSKKCAQKPDVVSIEDDSLRGSAADFIANAGDRVFYEFDKSSLSPEAVATLDRQVQWLSKHTDVKVLIEGHCDERGTREYNLGLGERRANSARKYLEDKGVTADRLRVVSYGKDRPIAVSGTGEEVHRMNRVSISVIEK